MLAKARRSDLSYQRHTLQRSNIVGDCGVLRRRMFERCDGTSRVGQLEAPPVYCMKCEHYPTPNLDVVQYSQSVLTRPTRFLLPRSWRYVEARKRIAIALGVWYVSNEMVRRSLDGKEKLCHLAAELRGSQFPGCTPLM
jgi:hypothetical protein